MSVRPEAVVEVAYIDMQHFTVSARHESVMMMLDVVGLVRVAQRHPDSFHF